MPKVQRTATGQSYMEPISYEQLTSLVAAAGLASIPAGATMAMIQPEAQNVRFRDDGVDPTAAAGMIVVANDVLFYTGNLSAIKFIQVSASAKINVTYYR